MPDIKVSIIASAIRVPFYKTFLDSLKGTTIPYEVIFSGHNTIEDIAPIKLEYPEFKYIHTSPIKPSQCYEAARVNAVGETIHWSADDCEYSADLIGKSYRRWKEINDEKVILSIQTRENGQFCDMTKHVFYSWDITTPLMAPLGLMSRKYLEHLGGFDRRFVCGQYENLCVIMAMSDGGRVEIFGDKENFINIDHMRRHGLVRPFATGYNTDRQVLEDLCADGKKVLLNLRKPFEPYIHDETFLLKSQSNKGKWE